MPPRSKRPAAPARATRSKPKTQAAANDSSEPTTTTAKQKPARGKGAPPGPPTRVTRSKLVLEVVLPASRRPSTKSSSALTTPLSPAPIPVVPVDDVPELDLSSPSGLPTNLRESTPPPKGNKAPDLPPSSPPPNSSPIQAPVWDPSSDSLFTTPTRSASRSHRLSNQPSAHHPTPPPVETNPTPVRKHPSSSPVDNHPDLAVASSPPPLGKDGSPTESRVYKPPTSPVPYSDTPVADDPFGFIAAEARLRERRVQLAQENPPSEALPLSSSGTQTVDSSTHEEAFASIFYDPESGTIDPGAGGYQKVGTDESSAVGSLYDSEVDENQAQVGVGKEQTKGKGKQRMEVVIPTKGKAKQTGDQKERATKRATRRRVEAPAETSLQAKRKTDERVLSTYELEAMLPHRPKRMRKHRDQQAEHILLSDVGEDEPSSSPKRRKKLPAKDKSSRKGKPATTGKSKQVQRASRRTRSAETASMDKETRQRFEAEQKRRLEAYKALDGYRLEEEEVVW